MASSSRHPKECQLSKDFVKWHFGGWDIWQHFDSLERLDEFMDGRNINSVEKYNILVEDIAQSYRDPRNSPIEVNMDIPRDPSMTASTIKRLLSDLSYAYLYFRQFVFHKKWVLYNFFSHKVQIDPNIYWDDGLDLEHFAWFRENGFPLYSMCRDVFEGKGLDTYARPYIGVEPFVPMGIDVCELTDVFRSYYREVKCFCGRGTF